MVAPHMDPNASTATDQTTGPEFVTPETITHVILEADQETEKTPDHALTTEAKADIADKAPQVAETEMRTKENFASSLKQLHLNLFQLMLLILKLRPPTKMKCLCPLTSFFTMLTIAQLHLKQNLTLEHKETFYP